MPFLDKDSLDQPIDTDYSKILDFIKKGYSTPDRGAGFLGAPSIEDRAMREYTDFLAAKEKAQKEKQELTTKYGEKDWSTPSTDYYSSLLKKYDMVTGGRSPASEEPTVEQQQPEEPVPAETAPLTKKVEPSIRKEYPEEGISIPELDKEQQEQKKEEPDYLSMLEQAKKQRDAVNLLSMLGKAGETISTGITGIVPGGVVTKPASGDFYANLAKLSETPISDLESKYKFTMAEKERARQDALRDPNSSESKMAQALVKQQGISGLESASAETISKYFPMISNLVSSREAREARKEERDLRKEELSIAKEERKRDKEDTTVNKDFTKMSEKLTSELASSRSSFGKSAGILRSAEALQNFIAGVDLKDVTTRQIYEIARGLDSMISQGAGTISGTGKLIPHTYSGDVAKIAEYLTNKVKGAKQQSFIKQMMDTVEREKNLANTQVQRTQQKILSGYSHLKKIDPERYNQVLKTFDLPTEEEPESKISMAEDKRADIQAYADDHFKGDYDKAYQYLKDSGQL